MIIAVMTLVFSLQGLVEAKDEKEEEKEEAPQFTVSGRDPMAFVDATAMYASSGQKVLDDPTARALLVDLEASLREGGPWSTQLWVQLDRFRASSVSTESVGELRQVAEKLVAPVTTPPKSQAKAAMRAFEKGNIQYETEKYGEAIVSYRSALENHPTFWDAWNNLGLAEMHNGNDLVAVFVFSALEKNNPEYAGGTINLSVCLERLDQADAAYDAASRIAEAPVQMPMAQYNMAWFENSRGNYESARTHLSEATEPVSGYAVAEWLHAINSMESGQSIGADEQEALHQADQSQGTPAITSRPVIGSRADAYSGEVVVTEIPGGSQLVISEKAGDWYSFYWPVDNRKRRLWIQGADLGNDEAVAAGDIEPFIGTWSGRWGTVTEKGLRIEDVDGRPKVTMRSDTAWDEKIEDGRLSFRVKVGGSGWEMIYTLNPVPEGLELEVFRVRDSKTITGMLKK
jgi:tetratricopeptide (TPR) repeat protein